jgi:hypothetical protein
MGTRLGFFLHYINTNQSLFKRGCLLFFSAKSRPTYKQVNACPMGW